MAIKSRSWWRRTPRHPADWFGKYTAERQPAEEWHPCRVINVSFGGARLELLGPGAAVGDRLLVELQTPATDVVRHPLHAEVRYAGKGYEGGVMAGVEFVELDDAGRSLLESLMAQQSHEGTA